MIGIGSLLIGGATQQVDARWIPLNSKARLYVQPFRMNPHLTKFIATVAGVVSDTSCHGGTEKYSVLPDLNGDWDVPILSRSVADSINNPPIILLTFSAHVGDATYQNGFPMGSCGGVPGNTETRSVDIGITVNGPFAAGGTSQLSFGIGPSPFQTGSFNAPDDDSPDDFFIGTLSSPDTWPYDFSSATVQLVPQFAT